MVWKRNTTMIKLSKEKTLILKADESDYDRGLLVKRLEDGGYKVAYWYEQTDKVPIALRASVTREDNEIIQMTKSDDDKYLAVMTGKFFNK